MCNFLPGAVLAGDERADREAERVERPRKDADGEVCPKAEERGMRWKQMGWVEWGMQLK